MADLKGDELILYGFKRVIEELKVIEGLLKETEHSSVVAQYSTASILHELQQLTDRKRSDDDGGLEKQV